MPVGGVAGGLPKGGGQGHPEGSGQDPQSLRSGGGLTDLSKGRERLPDLSSISTQGNQVQVTTPGNRDRE